MSHDPAENSVLTLAAEPSKTDSRGRCALASGSPLPHDFTIEIAEFDLFRVGPNGAMSLYASLNHTTDGTLTKWDWADHETQLAFRDAGEAVARNLLPNTTVSNAEPKS